MKFGNGCGAERKTCFVRARHKNCNFVFFESVLRVEAMNFCWLFGNVQFTCVAWLRIILLHLNYEHMLIAASKMCLIAPQSSGSCL